MSYLIDGHNLIPHIHGLSLDMIDDEERLVALLQAFCRKRRKQVECYFDNAPPGGSREKRYGFVTAHFIPTGSSADDALLRKLGNMKRNARNQIVVSSDHRVQVGAKAVGARVLSSDEFARELEESLHRKGDFDQQEEGWLTPAEVDEWMRLFKKGSGSDRHRTQS